MSKPDDRQAASERGEAPPPSALQRWLRSQITPFAQAVVDPLTGDDGEPLTDGGPGGAAIRDH